MSMGAFEWGLAETEVGLHTFSVRAIDFEGNVGEPTVFEWRLLGIVTIFLDGPGFTPPETPQDPPTGGEVASSTARIEFTSNVDNATFLCSLDLEPFLPCGELVSPTGQARYVEYTGLIAGSHELRVIAIGPDGIEEVEASVYEWEIIEFQDVAPPDTSIERAPANNSSSTIFEFTGVDDDAAVPADVRVPRSRCVPPGLLRSVQVLSNRSRVGARARRAGGRRLRGEVDRMKDEMQLCAGRCRSWPSRRAAEQRRPRLRSRPRPGGGLGPAIAGGSRALPTS